MIIKKIPKLQNIESDLSKLLEEERYDLFVDLVIDFGELLSEEPLKHTMCIKTFLAKSAGELCLVTIFADNLHGIEECIYSKYEPEVQKVSLKEVVSYEVVPFHVPKNRSF